MWFLSESFFDYLKERSTGQKIADMVVVIAVFTWIAAAYIMATNYDAIRRALFTQTIDMKQLVQLDKGINEILTAVMNQGGFDRAGLARLHDTVADLQGRHFVFESRSNEVVLPGVAPVAALRQNVLLSMINIWAQNFVKNECVYTTNLTPTDMYYEFYRQTGAKSDIKCPVYNNQGVWIGYTILEFTTKTLSVQELKLKEPMVRDASAKIGAILSIKPD